MRRCGVRDQTRIADPNPHLMSHDIKIHLTKSSPRRSVWGCFTWTAKICKKRNKPCLGCLRTNPQHDSQRQKYKTLLHNDIPFEQRTKHVNRSRRLRCYNPADADMQAGVSCCQSQPPIMPCHAGWTCIESILVRTQLCLSHLISRVTSLQASDKRWRESESSQLA